ncbi:hypothetical protein AAFF_G00329330 [Aldrovandia affinis]|uniref:Uncharacterized protein n=1 Tax=Aldrovandia affinis TaxID=143900 RepID=A0AAD7WPZ8_9TELE|nr:hypothetical protein AAFF_G00329330 [Aldrovandia affinis]
MCFHADIRIGEAPARGDRRCVICLMRAPEKISMRQYCWRAGGTGYRRTGSDTSLRCVLRRQTVYTCAKSCKKQQGREVRDGTGRRSMKPLTPIGSPSPLRLLNKGPDYLRRQMDGGGRGRSISAVERLEADKAKYVKSQQNANEYEEDDAKKENRQAVDMDERNRSNASRAALVTMAMTPSPRGGALVAPHSAPVLRRSTGKRGMRPDSLVIYRQKKECKTPNGGGGGGGTNGELKGYSFVRRLFQGSMREKGGGGVEGSPKMVIREERTPSRDGDSRMSWSNDKDAADGGKTERRPPTLERTRNGTHANGNANDDSADPWKLAAPQQRWAGGVGALRRAKSDLRLRCSLALSEKERFFDFCGLDLDMVERLGPENFLSGASSADTLSLVLRSTSGRGGGSDASEFSRHSGEGLFQEGVTEQLPSGVSIIERNARVIKWLYSCKNAAQEGPKESTV